MIDSDRNGSARAWQGLEPLEPRCLLSNGVIGVTQGLPDLAVTIAPSFKTPKNTLSGTGKVINLPILITNIVETTDTGQTVPVPAGLTATVVVVARPADAVDDTQDVQVGTLVDVPVGGMKVGAIKKLTVPVTLTDDVGDVGGGDWKLVVQLDTDNTVPELGEDPSGNPVQDNNTAQTAAFPVTIGKPDLTITIVSDKTLPSDTISSTGKTYNIPIRITNNGTLAIPKGATTTVGITLASTINIGNTNSSKDLDPITVNVGGLAPGHSVNATATVFFDDHVNNDDALLLDHVDTQDFTLTVDPGNAIADLHEENNTATTKPIQVTTGATSLLISQTANKQLPAKPIVSGGGQLIKATVKITNLGNITWDTMRSETYNVTLVAVAVGVDPDSTQDAPDGSGNDVASAIALAIPDLAPGKTTSYTMSGTLPMNMPSGQYNLYVRSDFTDTTGAAVTEYALAAPQPLNVVDGFINLVPTVDASTKLPKITTSGNGSPFKMIVNIKNAGNLPTAKDAAIGAEIDLLLADDPNFPGISVGATDDIPVTIGAIAPGKTKRIEIPYVINPGVGLNDIPPDHYVQQVTLLDTDKINELITGDNSAISKNTEQVIKGDPDLVLSLPAKLKLPADVLAGDGVPINLPFAIKNAGNIPTASDATTTIEVYATPAGGGTSILVATLSDIDLATLKPGSSVPENVPVTLTSDLASGAYVISAEVDPDNNVDELNELNNTIVLNPPMQVTQGLVDFAATIDAAALEGASVNSGDGSTVTLPLTIQNVGNLPVAKGQLIDIRVFAINTDTDDQTPTDVTTITGVKVGGMKAGGQTKLTLKVALPVALLSGNYQICAEVDSGHAVTEAGDTIDSSGGSPKPVNGANNTALGPNVVVTRHGSNLAVTFPPSLDLPAASVSGDGSVIVLPLDITNTGDTAVPRGQKITITIQAHNTADDDDTNDVPLAELDDYNIGGLAPGATRSLDVNLSLPPGMGPGQFAIVINIDSTDQLAELNENDNTATTADVV